MESGSAPFTFMLAILMLTIPLIGIFAALLPFLQPRGEVFSITVPHGAESDAYLIMLKRRYALIMVFFTLVFSLGGAVGVVTQNVGLITTLLLTGLLFLSAASYGLMLHFRSRVKAYKKEHAWHAKKDEKTALVNQGSVPHVVSFKWHLLYIPILLITLAIGLAGYPHLPDLIPQHINLQGQVTEYTHKGPFVIVFPPLLVAFLAACILFAHWSMLRSKKPLDPKAPMTSALAYGMFARAQSAMLVVSGLLIALVCPLMELAFMGVIGFLQTGIFVVVMTLIATIGTIGVSVVYGQNGSRVFKHIRESATMASDEDEHWKLGVFYYNPHDASVFLPKRFGVGWTLNMARPTAWVFMAVLLVVSVLFIIVSILFSH